MMNFETRLLESFNHFEPLRPIWVDQNIDVVSLDEKRGVTDPCDTNLALAKFWKVRPRLPTRAFNKKRWDQDAGEKIAPMPGRSRPQLDTGGTRKLRRLRAVT